MAHSESTAVPSEPATFLSLRPVWFTAWVSLAYSALLLVPSFLPIYGRLLPGDVWWGILVELLLLLGTATYIEATGRKGAWQWIASSLTAPGTAIFFTMGTIFLLTGQFGPISIGIAGALGLGMLVWIDSLAGPMDARGRSIAEALRG